MYCLDLGCGAGEVTFEIARLVGPSGRVAGMDMDLVKLELAGKRAAQEGVSNIEFRQSNVFEWDDDSVYDLIYVRFLLTHLPESQRVIPKLLRALRPGGILVVEDIDFAGYVSHPTNPAHDRFVNLYREVVRRRGGGADIGPKLLAMLAAADTQQLSLSIVYPEHEHGSGKDISLLTMIGISEAVLAEKLAQESELRELSSRVTPATPCPSFAAHACSKYGGVALLPSCGGSAECKAKSHVTAQQVEPAKHPLVQSAGEIAALLQDTKYDQALPKFDNPPETANPLRPNCTNQFSGASSSVARSSAGFRRSRIS
jgi:SAM-dependent methyltransferase